MGLIIGAKIGELHQLSFLISHPKTAGSPKCPCQVSSDNQKNTTTNYNKQDGPFGTLKFAIKHT